MIWLALAEAAVIVVLGLVVLALAHSYGGLAARVEGLTARGSAAAGARSSGGTATSRAPIRDLEATLLDGGAAVVAVAGAPRHTLLAFLSATCATCQRLWEGASDAVRSVLPDDVRLVIVAKDPEHESPAELEGCAAGLQDVDVVRSTVLWRSLEVPGAPYFVLLDRADGSVAGEGTARTWPQVADLMSLSGRDDRAGDGPRRSGDRIGRGQLREADVDRVLATAGIHPGDPSLYPEPAGEVPAR